MAVASGAPGTSPFPKPRYQQHEARTWTPLRDLLESPDFSTWAFRGQPSAEWRLESVLARYLRHSGVHRDHWEEQEQRILRIFRRKAHLHLAQLPNPRDSFQWLALMQHHGAPTRLLDFTWSPYVATFYALARPVEPGTDAAIWLVNQAALNRHHAHMAPWLLDSYEKHFLPGRHFMVVVGEPHHMNQRLIAHSATFAVPGRIDVPVDEIIADHVDPRAIQKITLVDVNGFRRRALTALYQMNITWATLLPGLDGLAQSLGTELELHWARDVAEPKPPAVRGIKRLFSRKRVQQ